MILTSLSGPAGSPAFGDLLTLVAAWLLAGGAGWAALIGLATLVEAASRGRLRATAWVGCPPTLRRTLLTLVGVALVSTPGHAGASMAGGSEQRSANALALAVPARPVSPAHAAVEVVVRPGDTLWHLAAAALPPTASAAQVSAQVARLHARNLAVIGADPDLIRPGQHLAVPHPITS